MPIPNFASKAFPRLWLHSPIQASSEIDKTVGFPILSPRYRDAYKRLGINDTIDDPELRGAISRRVCLATIHPASTFMDEGPRPTELDQALRRTSCHHGPKLHQWRLIQSPGVDRVDQHLAGPLQLLRLEDLHASRGSHGGRRRRRADEDEAAWRAGERLWRRNTAAPINPEETHHAGDASGRSTAQPAPEKLRTWGGCLAPSEEGSSPGRSALLAQSRADSLPAMAVPRDTGVGEASGPIITEHFQNHPQANEHGRRWKSPPMSYSAECHILRGGPFTFQARLRRRAPARVTASLRRLHGAFAASFWRAISALRSKKRWILPLGVLGNSPTKATCRG